MIDEHLSVDERVVISVAALHVAARTEREVVDQFRGPQPQSLEVNDVHVGERAGSEQSAVLDAE